MSAKKRPVDTPLELLRQLSGNLVEHLERACRKAMKEAETLLARLEKERGKVREKLLGMRARLDEAERDGKPKAQAKARARIAELEELLVLLQVRQNDTLDHLTRLRRDTERSLDLARGIRAVEAAAQAAAEGREPVAETSPTPPTATSARRPASRRPGTAKRPSRVGTAAKTSASSPRSQGNGQSRQVVDEVAGTPTTPDGQANP